jgi:hypothetical protein
MNLKENAMKRSITFAAVATLATAFTLSAAYAQRPASRANTRPAARAQKVVVKLVPKTAVEPTPAPQFIDIHPYQTASVIRQADGTILVVPAVVADWKISTPGQVEPKVYQKTALVYEKRNPLTETEILGGNYMFTKGNYLSTVSAEGFFTYKGKMAFEPNLIGGNFFTKKGTNEIVVIDSYGYFIETGITAPAIRILGGNFFIDQSGVLTTIKSVGLSGPGTKDGLVVAKTGSAAIDCSYALIAGANYFLKQDGGIVTIDAKNGFYSMPYYPESKPALLGGNYFIGMDNAVYTVSSEGTLFKTMTLKERPTLMGYSYMKFADGTFAIVTGNGGLHTEAVRVGAGGKSEYITKVPNALESKTYIPSNMRAN